MPQYNIWSEGFAATGQSAGAHLHGTETANSFAEALAKYVAKQPTDNRRYFNLSTSPPTYWGCRIYDNETQARKSFG